MAIAITKKTIVFVTQIESTGSGMLALVFCELGFYTLAGQPESPRELLDEVRLGEQMGLGSAFISERFNIKEAVTLSGAAAAVSSRIGIATAATNHNTRHPMVTASYATTMHRLTEGRFTLGLGRGIAPLFDAYGIPRITTAQMEDFVGLMRRLWRGEVVMGHDGPAGRFPILHLDSSFDYDIPLALTAFGPNSLALGGRAFDAVVLHTYFTDETLTRAVREVKQSAEQAGRDPAEVRVWSCYATVGDHLPEPVRLRKTVGRLATYLQGYGDLLVDTNGWDPAVLATFRADSMVASFPGAIDAKATTTELEHIATLIPDEWLEPAATGSAERCAERVLRQLDLGADGVIMHGASPEELAPVVDSYRAIRPPGRFDALAANPGAPGQLVDG
jgi:probable F420-dependent oxidoreductase